MYGTFRESMQFFDSGPTNRMTSRQKLQQITACHVEIVFRSVENITLELLGNSKFQKGLE